MLGFNHVGFKILIQVVTHAPGPELDGIEKFFLAQGHERAGEFKQVLKISRL